MSDFKAKMHQIRFRLGLRPRLRPRPRWGSLQRSPDFLDGFKRGYTSKGREGLEGEAGPEIVASYPKNCQYLSGDCQ